MGLSEDGLYTDESRVTRRILSGGARVATGNLMTVIIGAVFWIAVGALLGPEIVGLSSSVLSAAILASVLGGLSLSISILRLYMEYGRYSVVLAVLLSIVGTVLVALLVATLASGLFGGELGGYFPWIIALAVVTSTARVGQAALIACGCERLYTIAVGVGQALRLGAGLVLGYMVGVEGVLLGLLLGPLMVSVSGVVKGFTGGRSHYMPLSLKGVLDIIKVGMSNYPFMVSTQVMIPLTVMFTAYMTGAAIDTGVFYIMLNVVLAVGMPIYSVASVGIPRSVEYMDNTSLWRAGRVMLALITPLAAVTLSGSRLILSFFGPDYITGSTALTILALSIPAQAGLILGISYLNVVRSYARIMLSGITFLAVLPLSSIALQGRISMDATTLIAASYVIASYASLLATLLGEYVFFVFRALLVMGMAGAAGVIVSIVSASSIPGVMVSFLASIVLIRATGLSRLEDMAEAVKVMVSAVFK